MDMRRLGRTDILVSPLGLGTVKFGRNQQVKYPHAFALPDDREVSDLLALARELGINLLDTAPAYGSSMQRLGKLLPGPRDRWVIVSKVGEFFEQGRSRFDFSFATTVTTVEQSLRTLGRDYLDVVLIHSDGNDMHILQQEPVLKALDDLKQRGLIRAYGLSGKTLEGGLLAAEETDVVMLTCHPGYTDELPVIARARQLDRGVLIKKGLQSGHVAGPDGVRQAMRFIFDQPGVHGLIVGTINPRHLQDNMATLEAVLAGA